MRTPPRRTLKRLFDRYGPELVDDPRRTEALLNDLCPAYRPEIFVLVNAQRQQVPAELLAAPRWMPRHALRTRLIRRLQDKLSLTEDAALWAVDAWAFALGQSDPAPSRSPLFPRRKRAATAQPSPDTDALDDLAASDDSVSVPVPLTPAPERRTPTTRAHPSDLRDISPLRRFLASPLMWVAAISLAVIAVIPLVDGSLFTALPTPPPPILGYAGVDQPGVLLTRNYPLPRSAWVNAEPHLNVRTGPSIGYVALTEPLTNGETVSVDSFSADGTWAHISSPIAGWVSSQYLNYLSDADTETEVNLAVEELTVAATTTLHTGPGSDFPIAGSLPAATTVTAVASTSDGAWRHLAAPVAGWVPSTDLTP